MLGSKLLVAKPALARELQESDGEMLSSYNDFDSGDVVESILKGWELPPSIEDDESILNVMPLDTIHDDEDWELPPSIEDDEGMLSSRPLDIIPDEPECLQGEATLLIFI
jgi:hypothetical protein